MSEEPGKIPNPNPSNPGGFSADYIKELRDEAASWRTKFREQEQKTTTLEAEVGKLVKEHTLGTELAKRNLNVDPSWITLEEGKSPKEAVDAFLEKYPQFSSEGAGSPEPEPKPNQGRRPMTPQRPNSNVPRFANSDYESVKKDPIARAKLRDHYRSLLGENKITGK